MNSDHDDTLSELEAVTADMAALQDLGDARFGDLLERRGTLIRRLIATAWDVSDNRLASIIANADRIQEKLQRRCNSIRGELSKMETAGALMAVAKATFPSPEPKGVDISA